jgi:hypothetical protein
MRDRPHRRPRKDEAHRAHGVELQLVGHRQEVGAVGAQAVQHDDGGAGRRARVELDGLQIHGHRDQ